MAKQEELAKKHPQHMAVGHGIPGRYSRQFRKTAAARNDNPPHPIHAINSIGLSGAAETMPDADLTQFGKGITRTCTGLTPRLKMNLHHEVQLKR